jgi:hypothetical protein
MMIFSTKNILYVLFFAVLFFHKIDVEAGSGNNYNDFTTNPNITKEERKAAKPYLLPYSHPMRPALDTIFRNQRATFNATTFAGAGFTLLFDQPRSFIKVGSHPLLPGYLLKVFFDTDRRVKRNIPAWQWFVYRVQGVNKVQGVINTYNIKHFVTPKKWLYPLPIKPFPSTKVKFTRKNFLLLVENMNLVPYEKNLEAWKTIITKEHLDELFAIIKYAGGGAYRADNVAYTVDGKFALIDTEHPYKSGGFHSIEPYLSQEMLAYWKQLVKNQ